MGGSKNSTQGALTISRQTLKTAFNLPNKYRPHFPLDPG